RRLPAWTSRLFTPDIRQLFSLPLVSDADRPEVLGFEHYVGEVVFPWILFTIELERLPTGKPGPFPLDRQWLREGVRIHQGGVYRQCPAIGGLCDSLRDMHLVAMQRLVDFSRSIKADSVDDQRIPVPMCDRMPAVSRLEIIRMVCVEIDMP